MIQYSKRLPRGVDGMSGNRYNLLDGRAYYVIRPPFRARFNGII